jgi:hypothetical protein
VKPFSAKTICDRITLVVEHPRNFVLSPSFTGPDRRRRETKKMNPERRTSLDDKSVQVTELGGRIITKPSKDVTIINADYKLKEKIGKEVALKDLFSNAAIKKAQQVIADSTDEFISLIRDDLATLERNYTFIANNTNHAIADIKNFSDVALCIKSRAGIFNYGLATHVAESLYNLSVDREHINPKCARALRVHIDTLYVIFNEKITEMGGKMGGEIVNMLEKLTKSLV